MMHDLPKRRLTSREALAKERHEAELAMRDWLRAQAADRTPDGVHGGPFWYLIRVRHGSEWKTAVELRRWGIRAWCPRRRAVEKMPRSNRKRMYRQVICPGYLFVELAPAWASFLGVMSFGREVVGFVGSRHAPYQVRPSDIRILRDDVAALLSKKDGWDSLFSPGEMVMITDGAFADFDGRVDRPDNSRGRLRVEVNLFGRVTFFECGLDQVRPVG